STNLGIYNGYLQLPTFTTLGVYNSRYLRMARALPGAYGIGSRPCLGARTDIMRANRPRYLASYPPPSSFLTPLWRLCEPPSGLAQAPGAPYFDGAWKEALTRWLPGCLLLFWPDIHA